MEQVFIFYILNTILVYKIEKQMEKSDEKPWIFHEKQRYWNE